MVFSNESPALCQCAVQPFQDDVQFNLSLIAPFSKNVPVQSHSHSPKNPISQLPSGRDIGLACLVIATQVK